MKFIAILSSVWWTILLRNNRRLMIMMMFSIDPLLFVKYILSAFNAFGL
jgi:hypothetical protein